MGGVLTAVFRVRLADPFSTATSWGVPVGGHGRPPPCLPAAGRRPPDADPPWAACRLPIRRTPIRRSAGRRSAGRRSAGRRSAGRRSAGRRSAVACLPIRRSADPPPAACRLPEACRGLPPACRLPPARGLPWPARGLPWPARGLPWPAGLPGCQAARGTYLA